MTAVYLTESEPFQVSRPYSIKRHGLTLANCDSEPVQTPGCVQAHGAMLVLRLSDLRILQASENAEAVLKQAAQKLLDQPIDSVLGREGSNQLRALLDKQPVDCNPLYVMTLGTASGLPDTTAAQVDSVGGLDVTCHTVDGVVVLEFESTGRITGGNPDYYALVKQTVARLQTAGSLQQFCNSVVDEIRQLTGLDRVVIHKFHADGHGEIFTESKRADLSSWLGTHFPAEDIPKPARDIFSKIWIRPVPDISDELAEMVPLVNTDTGKPLDMTYCALRGVSIMYTEYLRNMGVTAAFTMPIRREENLWGLIAGHHYSGPKYISYQVRAACEFLAQVVSLQHRAAEDKEHLVYRLKLEDVHQRLIAAAADKGDLSTLTNCSLSMLDGIDAGGAALFYLDRWWCVGDTPEKAELEDLGKWLVTSETALASRPVYATDCLAKDYSPASAFADVVSGLLALPLSRSGNMMLWFRPEIIQTVNWRGNPHEKLTGTGIYGARLTPRRSFELFVESVRQRSLPWKSIELEAATRLRLAMMELVVGQAQRLANLNAELVRSNEELDAFAYVASHDLKEPLRGIHKYAHQLLENISPEDEESRAKLDRMMRLTLRMDSLIDSLLHFSRVGRAHLALETVDLNEVVGEALEVVSSRTRDVRSEIVMPRPLPAASCNRVWCREIFVNLLSNALKYTDQSDKRIELGYIGMGEIHPRPAFPEGSATHTIYYVADNGIGIQSKHFGQIFRLFKRLHGRDDYGGGTGAGLTIVRKLVEQHRGRVWVDSIPGQGTTFYFTLQGEHAG
jgi:chemotaxis family two-component system sensor kinase Cph1